MDDFIPLANRLRQLSVLGSASGADAADGFNPSNVQVGTVAPFNSAADSPLHLSIYPHTQELLNMLNESADAIGLHIRRFKCNTTSQCLDVHPLIARVPQAPPTVPSMSASTPLWHRTGECMRAPYCSH